jgi:putative restriction endonuclease
MTLGLIVKAPGDVNKNNQQLLRLTTESGTDYNARIWVLKCRSCGNIYGSNSTDAWERKCPHCQNGRPGLDIPTERDGKDWSREEHIIAFHLYNQIEFGQIDMRTPEVIELAALLGRKVGSASRKLANFARLDPVLQTREIKGLRHGAKGEAEVWMEFAERPEALVIESTRLLAEKLGRDIEEVADIQESDLPPPGREREALVRLRVNQTFFRHRVLSAFGFRCCVTGLTNRVLLTASHIVPWAQDAKNRLNPRNGLCLNPFHDRAFDRKLMWIDPDFRVRFSPALTCNSETPKGALAWLLSFEGKPLLLPKRFQPDPELLSHHASMARERVHLIS